MKLRFFLITNWIIFFSFPILHLLICLIGYVFFGGVSELVYMVSIVTTIVITSINVLVYIVNYFESDLYGYTIISFWNIYKTISYKSIFSEKVNKGEYIVCVGQSKDDIRYVIYRVNYLYLHKLSSYNIPSNNNVDEVRSGIKAVIEKDKHDIEKNKSTVQKGFELIEKWDGSLDDTSRRENAIDKVIK